MASRKYFIGKCEDCGFEKRVTRVTFWATGMKYVVCALCIRPYRKIILKPEVQLFPALFVLSVRKSACIEAKGDRNGTN